MVPVLPRKIGVPHSPGKFGYRAFAGLRTSSSELVHQRIMICLRDRRVAAARKRLPSLNSAETIGFVLSGKPKQITNSGHQQWKSLDQWVSSGHLPSLSSQ